MEDFNTKLKRAEATGTCVFCGSDTEPIIDYEIVHMGVIHVEETHIGFEAFCTGCEDTIAEDYEEVYYRQG